MPSIYELNAMPWGAATGAVSSSSVESLNSQELVKVPFSAGLTAADYRVQHELHGEAFRYWDATPLPDATAQSNADALIFTEVEVNGKGMPYQTKREVIDRELGLIPKGSTMFNVLPSVVEFRQDARVLRIAQRWRSRAVVTRGLGDTDELTERFVALIERVWVNGAQVPLNRVQAVSADSLDEDDKGGIKWLSNAPAAGTQYTVEFKYHPLFICLGESIQGEPIGADGERLPQRILLKKDRN